MPAAGAIRATRAYVELFADDSQLVRGLRSAQAKLKAFGSSVQQFGRQLLTMGTLAAAPLAASTKTFAGFEQEMARVKALTGANAAQFERLNAQAKRLGATTVFSASQAAEAMSFFALSGYSVDQILAASGPTLDLAAAGQLGMAQAADISAKIMAGMGVSANDLGRAIDVLTKGMTTANTDLVQLGDAMKYVGPVAKQAGYSLEETVAAVQLLSNAGIQADMAGTTLRGAILSLTDPSEEAKELLSQLGVSILDAQGDMRPLADIIDDMNRSLEGLGSGQKLGIIGRVFDARQAAGFAELMSQGGDRLRQATKALEDSEGTAARIAGTQLDTLYGSFLLFTSALEGVAIAIGEVLAPVLRDWGARLTVAANGLRRLIENNRELTATLAKGIAVGIAVGAALLTLGVAARVAGFALGGVVTVGKLGAGALSLLATAARWGGQAFLLLARILTTSVTTIVSTLTQLVTRLVSTVLTFLISGLSAGFTALAGTIAAVATPIGVLGIALLALGGYMVVVSGVIGSSIEALGTWFGGLQATALAAFQGIKDALVAGEFALAARILWLSLKMEWQKGISALNQQWIELKRFFVAVWTEAVYGAAEVAANAWAGLQAGWTKTIDFLADAWALFTTGLTKTWNTAVGFIRKAWVRLKSLFDSDLNAEAEVTRINEEVSGKNTAADDERNREISAREQQRRARRSEIEGERTGTLDELERMRDAEQQRNAEQFAGEVRDSEAALDAARREWQAALEEAARKRSEAEAGDAVDPNAPADLMQQLEEKLAAAGSGLQAAADKVSVSGTFNALAIRGLGGGSHAERTARAAEETARNTRRLLDEAHHGGLQFS